LQGADCVCRNHGKILSIFYAGHQSKGKIQKEAIKKTFFSKKLFFQKNSYSKRELMKIGTYKTINSSVQKL